MISVSQASLYQRMSTFLQTFNIQQRYNNSMRLRRIMFRVKSYIKQCSRVIDRKQKGYRQTDLLTYICKAICSFFFERGHKNNNANVNNIKIKFLLKG